MSIKKMSILAAAGLLFSSFAFAGSLTLISNANNAGLFIVNPTNQAVKCWGNGNNFPKGYKQTFSQSQLDQFKKCQAPSGQYGIQLVGAYSGVLSDPIAVPQNGSCTVSFFFGWHVSC